MLKRFDLQVAILSILSSRLCFVGNLVRLIAVLDTFFR